MPAFAMHSKASRQKMTVTLGGAGAAPSLTSKKSRVVLLSLRSDETSEFGRYRETDREKDFLDTCLRVCIQ